MVDRSVLFSSFCLLLCIFGLSRAAEEAAGDIKNTLAQKTAAWEAQHVSDFFSLNLTHEISAPTGGSGHNTYHSVPFAGTEKLDLSRYNTVKAWPNILHLVYVEDFYELKPPHFVTSSTVVESLSEPFMMEEGSQIVYQLAAIFFVPPDGHLIHFELENQGSNLVVVNKSTTEPYKNWSFLDFQNARLKPMGSVFLHAYYVKKKHMNLFFDFEPAGGEEKVKKVRRKVFYDNEADSDSSKHQVDSDSSKHDTSKELVDSKEPVDSTPRSKKTSAVDSDNGSASLLPPLFLLFVLIFFSNK